MTSTQPAAAYTVRSVSDDGFEKFLLELDDQVLARKLFDQLLTYPGDTVTLEAAGEVVAQRQAGRRSSS